MVRHDAYLQQTDLFGSGNKVYLNTVSYPVALNTLNNVTHKPNLVITSGAETIGDSTNLTRRKPQTLYTGVDAITITVSGKIDLDNLGSFSSSIYTMTPGLMYTILMNAHRTYYFYDTKVVDAWRNDPDPLNIVQYPFDDMGIPVQVISGQISPDVSENRLNYNLVLRQT